MSDGNFSMYINMESPISALYEENWLVLHPINEITIIIDVAIIPKDCLLRAILHFSLKN